MIAAVVLAAGAASRFGAQKLLAGIDGAPLVRIVTANVLASTVGEVVVVLGRDADRVRQTLGDLPVAFATNAEWPNGMAGSIRTGVRALPASVEGVLIVLGDQPTVTPAIIDRIVDAFRTSGKAIATPIYRGRAGNPVVFSSELFPTLMMLEGDRGARAVVDAQPDRVEAVPFDIDAPPDIDTPDDIRTHSGG